MAGTHMPMGHTPIDDDFAEQLSRTLSRTLSTEQLSFWSRLEGKLSEFLGRLRDQMENLPGGDCRGDHSDKMGEVLDMEDADAEAEVGESMGARRFVYGSTSPANGAKGFRILCYGDSNSAGFRGGGKPLSPYGQELAETLQAAGFSCEVTCCGLCGCTSEELVNLVNSPPLVDPKGTCPPGEGLVHLLRDAGPFDLVIIMVGTNDIGHSMDTRSSQAFATHLHDACHKLGIPTVNIAPTTVADDVGCRELRKRLAESMSRWASGCSKVLLSLDCEKLVPKSTLQLWETDQIHLSVAGSKQLGQHIASQLTLVLEQLS
jgi:lysophospholipase L1-like esterase